MRFEHLENDPLINQRLEKMRAIEALGVRPFGGAFPGAVPVAELLENFSEGRVVRVAGRLMTRRDMGKSAFAHIRDGSGKMQIFVSKDGVPEKEFEMFKKLVDLGDFVGADGELFLTRTGEKSVKVRSLTLLSKALRPLPDKWHGLSDPEQRYRQRYLDLVVNEDSRVVLEKRFRLMREVRNFFESHGFLEVETPMMQPVAGGAAARPFVTHHNALNLQLYLRIAPELYLKRLLVGGFEKVFEMNRNFRNEGISRRHNPEFTMLEAYWAYADYEMCAELVEELIAGLAKSVGYSGEIDFSRPFRRVKYCDAVRAAIGEDWFDLNKEQKLARAVSHGVKCAENLEDFEITQEVFEKLVEAKTLHPTYYIHLPKQLVPLAKCNPENPDVLDVFELVIAGVEVSPGYSELNDPLVQRARLLEQSGGETQALDEDFLLALEHGMPPAGGFGIGIDRLAMILCQAESIRDVILFPLLKPREVGSESPSGQ